MISTGRVSLEVAQERLDAAAAAPSVGRRSAIATRAFACALGSDYTMRLNVGGCEITLLPSETTRLIRYLARMADESRSAAE